MPSSEVQIRSWSCPHPVPRRQFASASATVQSDVQMKKMAVTPDTTYSGA